MSRRQFYHPDVWIFFISIPFIAAFNYLLTYSNIQFNSFLLVTFSIDTAQGYLAWLAVRKIIFYLDQTLPYEKGLGKRLLVQLVVTTLLGISIIALTTEMVSWIAKGVPAPLDFYTVDLLIISIWFLVINGVYVGIYFYRQWEKAEVERKNQKPAVPGISVKTGNLQSIVNFEEIALFQVDTDYVQLVRKDNVKHYLDLSLDRVLEKLPPHDFFRLNRQYIVHRQVVAGFKRIENNKLLVQLNFKADLPEGFTVSRTKAPAFKSWFLPQ